MANNYAKDKPTVVLLWDEVNMEAPTVLTEDGKPKVFENFKFASRYVANVIEPKHHKHIHYANEQPVMGAGDIEDTGGRKCLRCGTQLVLSGEQSVSELPDLGVMAVDLFDCPKCVLERPRH